MRRRPCWSLWFPQPLLRSPKDACAFSPIPSKSAVPAWSARRARNGSKRGCSRCGGSATTGCRSRGRASARSSSSRRCAGICVSPGEASGARRSRASCSCAAWRKPRPSARTSSRCCRRWESPDRDLRGRSYGRCRSRRAFQTMMNFTGRAMKIRLGIAASIATACFAGCGGPSGSTPGSTTHPAAATYTIGGAIAGLTGSGLVLRLNGTGNLPVNPNATAFTFITQLASGAAYTVSVFTQPTGPSQTCTVTNSSGTVGSSNVAGISVSCTTNSFTIGGTVSGLLGAGLVLQNNGGNDLAIGGNGAFTFTTSILSGATYAVTVLTQPSGPVQSCNVPGGSGARSEEHTSELQSQSNLVCRLLLEK